MHNDTCKMLKRATDAIRKDVDMKSPAQAFHTTIALAQAESLLAAHEAQTTPLPSRFATVHPHDYSSTTGTIEAIPGGYRIYWHDMDVEPGCAFPAIRCRDILAIHSIDWLTEQQYAAHVEQVHKTCHERAKEYHRRRHWPEGYRLVKRSTEQHPHLVYGIQRIVDGWVLGFWRDCGAPLSEVWDIVDGGDGAFCELPYPVEPCADMPLPF